MNRADTDASRDPSRAQATLAAHSGTLAVGTAALVAPDITAVVGTVAQAEARLAASRAALHRAMLPPQDNDSPRRPARPWHRSTWWRQALRQWPLLGLAQQAAWSAWRQHPLHDPAQGLANAVSAQASPLIRRHPWLAVGGAALAGAGLMAWRPWRQPWAKALGQPWGASLRSVSQGIMAPWLRQALSDLPWQSALTALAAWGAQRASSAAAQHAKTPEKMHEKAPSPPLSDPPQGGPATPPTQRQAS